MITWEGGAEGLWGACQYSRWMRRGGGVYTGCGVGGSAKEAVLWVSATVVMGCGMLQLRLCCCLFPLFFACPTPQGHMVSAVAGATLLPMLIPMLLLLLLLPLCRYLMLFSFKMAPAAAGPMVRQAVNAIRLFCFTYERNVGWCVCGSPGTRTSRHC